MEFQQKHFKRILTIAFALLFSFQLFAEENFYKTKIIAKILDNGSVNVKVFAPKNNGGFISFSLGGNLPKYLQENLKNFNVSSIKIYYSKDRFKEYSFTDKILIEEEFYFLEYTVSRTVIDNNSFLAVSNFSSSNVYSFISFHSFLGVFEGFENKNTTLILFKNKEIIFEKTSIYSSLINESICFGCEKIELDIDANNLNIIYNRNQTISKEELQKNVTESIVALQKHIEFDNEILKKMTFLFDTISNNTGAINTMNNIVFHFNKNDKYIIQKTIIHEILHWLIPNQNTWLDESLAEYLAIKTMLKAGLITDDVFFEKMSDKMKLADFYKNNSLESIYNTTALHKVLYSKGAVYAWMMDLVLLKKSANRFDLEQNIFNKKSINNSDLEFLAEELIRFEKVYVVENHKLYYNQFLNVFGVLFEENKLQEIKAKQNLVLEKRGEDIVIIDKASLCCLNNNDILISLDREKEYEKIKEKLSSLSEKNSYFVIKRNGKKERYIVSNKESLMKKTRFNLSFLENVSDKQKLNWKKYKTH